MKPRYKYNWKEKRWVLTGPLELIISIRDIFKIEKPKPLCGVRFNCDYFRNPKYDAFIHK